MTFVKKNIETFCSVIRGLHLVTKLWRTLFIHGPNRRSCAD